MNRETIEKAADSYAAIARPSFVNGEFDRNAIADAFEKGAHWRINSVWHDARKEVPKEFIPILVERDDFTFSVNMVGGNMTSCPLHWVRWSYINDLMKRKEAHYDVLLGFCPRCWHCLHTSRGWCNRFDDDYDDEEE